MALDFGKLSTYHFDLPSGLIAQTPLEKRDESRLLVIDRANQKISDHLFKELPEHLNSNDCLVFNETRVRHCRLHGKLKTPSTIKQVELFLLNENDTVWECMAKPGKIFKEKATVDLPDGHTATYLDRRGDSFFFQFLTPHGHIMNKEEVDAYLENKGEVPLPPYIKTNLKQKERYQTLFNRKTGSAAAPTAGLHFTQTILEKIDSLSIKRVALNLEIGLGTFKPIRTQILDEHQMHSEKYFLSQETVDAIKTHASNPKNKIVAVGTTSLRALEGNWRKHGDFFPGEYSTDIFIRPPDEIQSAQGLLTNFHLPESTLLMLVSAFAGHTLTMEAYNHAIKEQYRFFSFGDAMLII